jgi:serine/threonine-protein kinase
MTLMRPTQIGKYHIIGELARGGMGVVYLVATRGPGDFSKLLVLKELQPDLAEEPALLEMFFEEARLAARLNHPNIVQTYEVGTEGKRHYIVMDYLSGRALSRVLRRRDKAFTLAMHLRVLCEVLRGLDYAHRLTGFDGKAIGIVHRDVNPQNVFITFDGQVKLLDFGIAKALDSHIETRTGVLKGKPGYMAPEQLAGRIDTRADIYAVGTMIWEAIAGRRLWSGKTDVEILSQLMEGKLPSLADTVPDAPPALVRMCEKAMARDPADRHATAAELLAELQAYLAESGDAPTVRDAAAVVTRMFAEDHTNTRAAIDRCLAALREGETEIIPAPLSAHLQEGTPSGAGIGARTEPPPSTPMPPTPPATAVTAATLAMPSAAQPQPPRRGWLLPAILGGALLLALIGVGVLQLAEPPPEATPAGALAPPVTPQLTAEPAKPPPSPDPPPAATEADPVASSSAVPASPRVQAAPRVVRSGRSTTTAAPAPPQPASTCNPPFYFEGTKKVYKPGCI